MLRYAPQRIPLAYPKGDTISNPLADLFEGMLRINAAQPRLIENFFAACEEIGCPPEGPLMHAVTEFKREPSGVPQAELQATNVEPSSISIEKIFVASRDALNSDWTTDAWVRAAFTYHDFCLALKQEIERLKVGDDPSSPW